jgi:hypothetical protein
MSSVAPTSSPSALFFEFLQEGGLLLQGMKAASAFKDATDLSHMTYRRLGLGAFIKHANSIRAYQTQTWLPRQMRAWGTSEDEIAEAVSSMPERGAATTAVYALGFRGDDLSPHLTQTVALLDAADERLLELYLKGDSDSCLEELGPDSLLGPDYCEPLKVAGIGTLGDRPAADPSLIAWVHHRRAHMALSFLAAIDHEMSIWRERQVTDCQWRGISRFGSLLLDPPLALKQRLDQTDPIARLVSLIGVQASILETGRWPEREPTVAEMGRRVDASGLVHMDGAAFIGKLKAGQKRLTSYNFRLLVRAQLAGANASPTFEPLALASMLLPYLVAAHHFTLLMPRIGKSARRDRTGWRSAYLTWWRRHAIAQHRPTVGVSDSLPSWLTAPGC